MSEEINKELLEIIKALTSKIEKLEETVYASDGILRKAGFVAVNSPRPQIGVVENSKTVGDMEWGDIHKMFNQMGGQ